MWNKIPHYASPNTKLGHHARTKTPPVPIPDMDEFVHQGEGARLATAAALALRSNDVASV
jgi:hypothetical protein